MTFITISVKCTPDLSDILIAELFALGFDSFQEFEDGFEGSCDQSQFSEQSLKDLLSSHTHASYAIKTQEKVNWNEEWEKNYEPIVIEDKCIVRATFHPKSKDYEHEIIINPKMSFGTGHHATTYQMLAYQLEIDFLGKSVLDVGCGTGVLSIMAHKLGAKNIVATDIDDWCIENSEENFSLNEMSNYDLIKGEIDVVEKSEFDIIIANINKNVLMAQIEAYSQKLVNGGSLLLSGFYVDDEQDLIEKAKEFGLSKKTETNRENWAMLAFTKQFV